MKLPSWLPNYSRWSQSRFMRIIERHRVVYAVILALGITMLFTSISLALYVSSGASRLDLSRPGYEKVRDEIQQSSEEAFSSTGPINVEVANDFQSRFVKHRQVLDKLDTYGTNALDDNELQIAPSSN